MTTTFKNIIGDGTVVVAPNSPETAFMSSAFPCNPRPFARRIDELVSERGSDAITDDDVKACLLILMQQAYGQLATIDLCNEWTRLSGVINTNGGR